MGTSFEVSISLFLTETLDWKRFLGFQREESFHSIIFEKLWTSDLNLISIGIYT